MTKVRTMMNQRQKNALAALVLRGVADILDHYQVRYERYPEHLDLVGVPVDELRAQVAMWLGRYLPGDAWDERLPRTFLPAKYGARTTDRREDTRTAGDKYWERPRGWVPTPEEEPGEPEEEEPE